ncbi:MAG TPA: GNAT family N-acetyltransferase [Ilumatobacteraceae bacterium]|nr:GNAT family N-acetyltransferase [Ilumatobacteraceae bacterium]
MTRTRSEYRLAPIPVDPTPASQVARRPLDADRDALARVMLDAYRGTIDDEGEGIDDAIAAVDHSLAMAVREHSFVLSEGAAVSAFSFVVVVNDLHYIDPIVVAPERKGQGLGRDMVAQCLRSLADAGVSEVGATITDGNVASERLFMGLGFTRRGAWGS